MFHPARVGVPESKVVPPLMSRGKSLAIVGKLDGVCGRFTSCLPQCLARAAIVEVQITVAIRTEQAAAIGRQSHGFGTDIGRKRAILSRCRIQDERSVTVGKGHNTVVR